LEIAMLRTIQPALIRGRLTVLAIPAIIYMAACAATEPQPVKSAAEPQSGGPTAADYQRAFSLDDSKLRTLPRNASTVPHWLGEGEAFWFAQETDSGFEYFRVESATGQREPLFDHAALATAVNAVLAASGRDVEPASGSDGLNLRISAYDPQQQTVSGTAAGKTLSCTLRIAECETVEVPTAEPGLLLSPDGKRAAFTRDHNLWLRDMASGQERALTTDGEAYFSWGKVPDTSLAAIPQQRDHLVKPPYATFWSPDGSKLVATRMDERDVGIYPFVEWAPLDGSVRPKLYQLRIPLMGDPLPKLESHVFDVATGEHVQIDAGEGYSVAPAGVVGWSANSQRLYMLAANYGSSALRLLEFSHGKTRVAFEEKSDTLARLGPAAYNEPNVRLLKDGAEALWFSERSGWGHLYRIDLDSGAVLKALTAGDWTVQDVLRVDEADGRVYFTAGGREAGDPYQRRLYRVNLDGSDFTLLTPEAADHALPGVPSFLIRTVFGFPVPPDRISPDGRYFVAEYSTLEEPPVSVLRSTDDGRIIAELQKADVSKLAERGYRPPERFSATAADGQTTIWGAIYLPPDFDPAKSYPVINALYAGPQVSIAPFNYLSGFSGLGQYNRAALASLGFIVVTVDGRGTPYRSLEFQNASRGLGHGTEALRDHRAAIEELAAKRPYMDLTRVGVYGHSWGGYHTALAIMQHNDFYDAAVASAGLYGYQWSYPGFESFIGLPDYGNGSTIRPEPGTVAENFQAISVPPLANQLNQGHLMIAYGDVDENVQPSQAVQLIDALIKADRDFDLLYLPNRTHYYVPEPYFQRRLWDYMVEHAMGAEPPEYSHLESATDP
jgi:dipeptidyl aminopeptidase/acylaminoacyl peptidase